MEVGEDRYQFIPSYGPDGIDEPGTGAVLGRAFQRRVREKEQLAHVKNMKRRSGVGCCVYWTSTTNCKRGRRCKLGLFGKNCLTTRPSREIFKIATA